MSKPTSTPEEPTPEPEEAKQEPAEVDLSASNPKPKQASRKPKHKNTEQVKLDNEPSAGIVKAAPGLSLVHEETPPSEPGKYKSLVNSSYPSTLASLRKLQERRNDNYNDLISKMF